MWHKWQLSTNNPPEQKTKNKLWYDKGRGVIIVVCYCALIHLHWSFLYLGSSLWGDMSEALINISLFPPLSLQYLSSVHWVSARDRKHSLQSANLAGRGTKKKKKKGKKTPFSLFNIKFLSLSLYLKSEVTEALITATLFRPQGQLNLWHSKF